jgi:iron complex transport system permease protein
MVRTSGPPNQLAAGLLINLPWEQHFLHLNPIHALIGGPVVAWLIFGRKSGRGLAV